MKLARIVVAVAVCVLVAEGARIKSQAEPKSDKQYKQEAPPQPYDPDIHLPGCGLVSTAKLAKEIATWPARPEIKSRTSGSILVAFTQHCLEPPTRCPESRLGPPIGCCLETPT